MASASMLDDAAVASGATGDAASSIISAVGYRSTMESESVGTMSMCASSRSNGMPSRRARIDASTAVPCARLAARPDRADPGHADLGSGRHISDWTATGSLCGRLGSAATGSIDRAIGARHAVLFQPLRRPLRRRHDLTISLAPCLTAEDVPEAEHRQAAKSHEPFFRRSDDTAALAAVTVTTPVRAAAPVFTAGFL